MVISLVSISFSIINQSHSAPTENYNVFNLIEMIYLITIVATSEKFKWMMPCQLETTIRSFGMFLYNPRHTPTNGVDPPWICPAAVFFQFFALMIEDPKAV